MRRRVLPSLVIASMLAAMLPLPRPAWADGAPAPAPPPTAPATTKAAAPPAAPATKRAAPSAARASAPAAASASSAPAGAPAAAPTAAAIADEVKLKDGSVFRGTILEYVSGDHVDLLLPSGQTRRFPMADVAYQGPASGASEDSSDSSDDSDSDDSSAAPPPRAAPPAPARPPRPASRAGSNDVDVHVTSDQDDVGLLFRTGQSDFEGYGAGYRTLVAVSGSARNYALVCNAPCDTQLPRGTHRMALSLGGGRAVEADTPVQLEDRSTIRVHYESRSGTRAGGWVLFGLSMAAGFALFAAGELHTSQSCFNTYCPNTPTPDQGEVAGGLALAIVGPLLSLALILQHDHAQIEIVPDNAARLLKLPGRGGETLMAAPASAPGPALRVRF